MQEYVLLVFDMNWHDEFDLYGLRILTKEYWEKLEKAVNSVKDYMPGWYFGTNEGFDEETFEDILDNIKVIPLNEVDRDVLKKLKINKKWGAGQFPRFEDLLHDLSLEAPHEVTPEIEAIIYGSDD